MSSSCLFVIQGPKHKMQVDVLASKSLLSVSVSFITGTSCCINLHLNAPRKLRNQYADGHSSCVKLERF